MRLVDAVAALRDVRGDDDVVITTMGVAREWMTTSTHRLDLVYVPSTMGQATSLGLGLALACPDRRIIVCNGDGSMLMNLGSLVSITAEGPTNLTVLLFDNGVYEVTGAQPTPGSAAGRRDRAGVDFLGIARSCGFRSAFSFSEIAPWRREARAVIDAHGPTFALLEVAAVPGGAGPRSPGPGIDRAMRFMAALRNGRRGRR